MVIGFIGLGNVGQKLACTLVRNKIQTYVHDLIYENASHLIKGGAKWAKTPAEVASKCDIIITCLPSPKVSAEVIEGKAGVLSGIRSGKTWVEMSTSEASEVKRLGKVFKKLDVTSADCPVSGGCHKAETGNISIFAGCDRSVFDKIKPILFLLGNQVIHTGALGSASVLKVTTNYLATTHLLACCEALTTLKAAKIDLGIAYEAIRISSGNSFVHETESQVILNGSRDINFTLDLVLKDITIFQNVAKSNKVPLEMSPLIIKIIKKGIEELGERANSPSIIERLEAATGLKVTSPGFPEKIYDADEERPGVEISR